MFGRTLNVLINGVALATAAAIALVVGTACKDPPDSWGPPPDAYTAVAWGANVVPAATDTAPRAGVNVNISTNPIVDMIAWSYSISTAPSGTIDSIAFYQVAAGDTLSASATAILCAGAAACASTSGKAAILPPATAAMIKTSMRAYGTQLVFFTATAQHAAGGAMRGTMYPSP